MVYGEINQDRSTSHKCNDNVFTLLWEGGVKEILKEIDVQGDILADRNDSRSLVWELKYPHGLWILRSK